jgi:hypothetical protein
MSDVTLGQLPDVKADRDAVHVAITPVEADTLLYPGQHVILKDGKAIAQLADAVGIVDPFLPPGTKIEAGTKFWLCLYPKTVTGIRHHWSHPAFADTIPVCGGAERDWITLFARRWEYTFDEFMAAARRYIEKGEELDDKWVQAYDGDIYADWEIFWKHFHTLTGLSLNGKEREFVRCCPN